MRKLSLIWTIFPALKSVQVVQNFIVPRLSLYNLKFGLVWMKGVHWNGAGWGCRWGFLRSYLICPASRGIKYFTPLTNLSCTPQPWLLTLHNLFFVFILLFHWQICILWYLCLDKIFRINYPGSSLVILNIAYIFSYLCELIKYIFFCPTVDR